MTAAVAPPARRAAVLVAAAVLLLSAASAAAGAEAKCKLPKAEVLALKDMYESLGGPEWRHQGGWLKGDPCGSGEGGGDAASASSSYGSDAWLGVVCGKCRGGVRHVQVLTLEWNNLVGNISDAVGLLTDLRVLNLGTNSVSGEIPASLGDCKKLRVLKLSYNKIEGKYPPELLGLGDLEMVDLPYNDIVADLNAMIVAYPKLRVVNARGNRGFGGDLGAPEVREALRAHQALETLDLHWNNVGGELPAELFEIATLEEVHLTNNQLIGPLPPVGAARKSLRVLELGNNYLEGELHESYAAAEKLEDLVLDKNMVSGVVPAALGGLASLKRLNLRWNMLSGGVPPELGGLSALEELELSANPLGGSIPAELGSLASLKRLGLHSCRLTGTLPTTVGGLESLERLEAFNNKISGEVPAEIGRLVALERLSLRSNRLSGALPDEIGNLGELRSLQLHRNRLTGVPDSVGRLASLERLQLQDNEFGGPMPEAIGRLTRLRVLNLHNNRFTGASLPASYGDLFDLDDFTAHDNLVEGNPYPRVDPGIDDTRPFVPEAHEPFCEDLRDYETGGLTHQYFRVCGTRNDFFVDLLLGDKRSEWRETHGESWMAAYGKCKPTGRYDEHSSFQRTSRFADMREVADKSKFAAYVKRQHRLQGDAFDFHPPTFRMPFDKAAWLREAEAHPEKLWLLKPSISCCGQNIRLIDGPDDPTYPEDEGNWILQEFVHPPLLVDGHKVVLRLFAIVTSMSPLRVYLYPDGDVFYSHAPYTTDPAKRHKRGYFISDYFFTLKQRDYFTTTNELFDHLRRFGGEIDPAAGEGKGIDTDQIYRDVRDAIVRGLQVSEPQYRMAQDETIAYPESTYEVMGYDILIDKNLKPHVCEINTTPNMGLEVQHHGSALIHEEDFRVKTDIMRACLTITGTLETGAANATDAACDAYVREKLASTGRGVSETEKAWCPEDDLEFTCLTEDDVALLVRYECELRRRDGFEEMFPADNAEELLKTFPVHRRENHLQVWWYRTRDAEPAGEHAHAWVRPTPRPFRSGAYENYDWSKHRWTANTPGNRWNVEEDGRYPDENEEHDYFINDGDAFEDDEDHPVEGDMSAILDQHTQREAVLSGDAGDGSAPADAAYGDQTADYEERTAENDRILKELEDIDWDNVDWDTFDWDRYGLRDPRSMTEAELDELMKDDPDYKKAKDERLEVFGDGGFIPDDSGAVPEWGDDGGPPEGEGDGDDIEDDSAAPRHDEL